MIYGYGEDALTLVLVGQQVHGFVRALEGRLPTRTPTVLYRPSFGRRATERTAEAVVGAPRAAFGEFDAIVGTELGTYLVEVKWSRSGGVGPDGVLVLADAQVRRHRVMRHYLDAWRATTAYDASASAPPPDPASGREDRAAGPPAIPLGVRWQRFVQSSDIAARLAAEGVAVPRPRTRLADTLTRVLGLLDRCGPVRDVLLFAATGHRPSQSARRARRSPGAVHPPHFDLVGADLRYSQPGPLVFLPTFPDDPGGASYYRIGPR